MRTARVPTTVPPENAVHAITEALSSKRIEDLTSLRLCLSLMNEIRRCARRERQFGRKFQRPQGDAARSAMGFGFFRQPVVHSGGAAHRLATRTQPTHFWRLNRSWLRRVLPQRKKRSRSIIHFEDTNARLFT